MKNFENNLINLLFDLREYGIVVTNIELPNGSLRLQDYRQRLVKNCHIGFRNAHNFLVEEIIKYQNEINQLEENLKLFKRNKEQKNIAVSVIGF